MCYFCFRSNEMLKLEGRPVLNRKNTDYLAPPLQKKAINAYLMENEELVLKNLCAFAACLDIKIYAVTFFKLCVKVHCI